MTCPTCGQECGWDAAAEARAAERLDVALGVDVVREIDRYHEKLSGRRPWVDFEALLPESVRGQA